MQSVENASRERVAMVAALATQDESAPPNTLQAAEFVSHVLREVAPGHYARVSRTPGDAVPSAQNYFEFLQSLIHDDKTGWRRRYVLDRATVYEGDQGWRRVERMHEARRGDLIACPTSYATDEENGHLFFVAETPMSAGPGRVAVRVYDSCRRPHFEDQRTTTCTEGRSVVGEGTVLFRVNSAGVATAAQLGPTDRFRPRPIVIGRLARLAP